MSQTERADQRKVEANGEIMPDDLMDEIMTQLLADWDDRMLYNNDSNNDNNIADNLYADVYGEICSQGCPMLEQTEQQRILQAVLHKIEEEDNMSNNNNQNNKVYRLGRKRWLTFGLAAVLMLAMSSLALAEFGLAPDFLGFFNAGQGQAGSLQQSGQEIMRQAENNGATLTVEQVVGDRHSVYVLLDFMAPEGVVLNQEDYRWDQAWVTAASSTGGGYHFEMLPDDNPTDNHIRMMLCFSASESLQGDTVSLDLADLQSYSVADQDYVMAVEGSWQLSFKLDYVINSQTIPQGVDIQLGSAVARVVDMELSPISLILNVETENPEGFEPLAGYVEPQGGGVAIDQDGNEVYYDYDEEPIEVRLNDFLSDLDNLTVRLKDGTVLNTQGGGGHAEGSRAQVIFSFDRILNVEDIASISYCGKELTLK